MGVVEPGGGRRSTRPFVGFGASGAPDAAKGVFDEVGYKTLALDVMRERALLAEA